VGESSSQQQLSSALVKLSDLTPFIRNPHVMIRVISKVSRPSKKKKDMTLHFVLCRGEGGEDMGLCIFERDNHKPPQLEENQIYILGNVKVQRTSRFSPFRGDYEMVLSEQSAVIPVEDKGQILGKLRD
jgi:hypothetical protein